MKRTDIIKIAVILVIFILVGSIFFYLSATSQENYRNLSSLEPILVSHAQKIPKIDGMVENEEWDDAIMYTYHTDEKEINLLGKHIHYLSTDMKLSIKEYGDWLYILVEVNDDVENGKDSVTVFLEANIPPHWGISFYHNGTALSCSWVYTQCGDFYPTNCRKDVNATFASTYSNGEYIFEIKMSRDYLNVTNNYAPFSLEFMDSDDKKNNIETLSGIKLIGELPSKYKYYVQTGEVPPSPQDYLLLGIITEESLAIVILLVLYVKDRKRLSDLKNKKCDEK